MLVIALCVLLVAAGLALVVRPRTTTRPRGTLRDVAVVVAAGLAGVLAGGRLVMRLLALARGSSRCAPTTSTSLVLVMLPSFVSAVSEIT